MSFVEFISSINVPVENIESLGELIKFSEGAYKDAYYIQGTTDYVALIYKDISDDTLKDRIKEVICYL